MHRIIALWMAVGGLTDVICIFLLLAIVRPDLMSNPYWTALAVILIVGVSVLVAIGMGFLIFILIDKE